MFPSLQLPGRIRLPRILRERHGRSPAPFIADETAPIRSTTTRPITDALRPYDASMIGRMNRRRRTAVPSVTGGGDWFGAAGLRLLVMAAPAALRLLCPAVEQALRELVEPHVGLLSVGEHGVDPRAGSRDRADAVQC